MHLPELSQREICIKLDKLRIEICKSTLTLIHKDWCAILLFSHLTHRLKLNISIQSEHYDKEDNSINKCDSNNSLNLNVQCFCVVFSFIKVFLLGDLKVAMETLLTAISIIKQSRVYQDDRCQALVTSLKDCLMSIQRGYGNSRSVLTTYWRCI